MERYAASEARANFSDILNRVGVAGEVIVVQRHGEDLVAIVPMARLEAGAGASGNDAAEADASEATAGKAAPPGGAPTHAAATAPDLQRLFELSLSERLQLVQDLWDGIAREPGPVPVDAQARAALENVSPAPGRRADEDVAGGWKALVDRIVGGGR